MKELDMTQVKQIISLFALSCLSGWTFAEIKGTSFVHENWEIYCDNTGTCRAAGYQDEDGSDAPVSILLTRHAGPQQAVKIEFALGDGFEEVKSSQLKNIHLYVNGQDLGTIQGDGRDAPILGTLNKVQTQKIIDQAQKSAEIHFKNAYFDWIVSDRGMTATLLKMDDFQKRVGTVGALVKKGATNENQVLKAQPKRVVQHIKVSNQSYLTLSPKQKAYQNLHEKLMAVLPQDFECEGYYANDDMQSQPIELYKLNNQKVMAMTPCWRGAYNEGSGIWMLDEAFKKAEFVTDQASDYEAGIIHSAQKGRGIGDCWASAEWVWNGQHFIQTVDRWSGMCKGIAAGGVWNLDLIDAVVK